MYRLVARSPAAPLLKLPRIERARRRVTATEMTGADVVKIVHLLTDAGIDTWLAGGWACDALLGQQTRFHADLDIVVADTDRQRALDVLKADGFSAFAAFNIGQATSVVELVDRVRLRRVGLHLVTTEASGDGGWAASLRASMQALGMDTTELFAVGAVIGHEMLCLSAPVLMAMHTGHELDVKNRRDVELLRRRFSLPAPPGCETTPAAN